MNRLKVLISSHELSPDQGSECAIGWNLVTRIAQYHDVTVLYARGSHVSQDAYEKAITGWIEKFGNPYYINFIAVPQPRIAILLIRLNRFFSKKSSSIGSPLLFFIAYRIWQRETLRIATRLNKIDRYQIVHHLTSLSFKEPGLLWRLNVTFVWGPTGGNSTLPVSFYRHIGFRTAVYEAMRAVTTPLALHLGQRINQAISKSSLIYAFSENDQDKFRKRGAKEVKVMLDAGCAPAFAGMTREVSELENFNSKLKVLWCGQLIKRKALDILLKAVAGDPFLKENVEITVVGDGPLRNHYERSARNLIPDIRYQVTFVGLLPRDQVFNYMKSSDVLVHTSYREATSNVIPEALSFGLPVICHDISGMAIAIKDECGIKVPLKSYEESILGFRNALLRMVEGEVDLRSGALRRAAELSWDSMAETIATDYLRIVESK